MHTYWCSVAFSRPEESMQPVNQMVLSCILPNSEQTKHMFSGFGNVMGPKEKHAQVFE